MQNNKRLITSIVVLALAGSGIFLLVYRAPASPETAAFAGCLTERGATYYGAFWCPRCQEQNTMFGSAKEKLNYVECSTPDGKGQLPICQEAKITGYPTWEFSDGSRLSGVQRFEVLAQKTGCPLPQKP